MCSAASGDATSADSSGSTQWPSGAAGAAERLPQRRQVGGVDDLEGDVLHLLQTFGRDADTDALSFGEREHTVRVVGVDDGRAAVGHLPALLEHLGLDLDALDVAARVEDLAGVDDRVRHGLQVGDATAVR